MADKGPNFMAEQLKLKISIDTLSVGLIRAQLEIAEAEGRIAAAKTNIKSTHKAIGEGEERLQRLIKDHGNLIEGGLENG